MQLIVHCLGGKVEGLRKVSLDGCRWWIFDAHETVRRISRPQNVWMSHGDEAD